MGLASSRDTNGRTNVATLAWITAVSGWDEDKFKKTGLTQVRSTSVKTPGIKECAARLECKAVDTKEAGDHTLFIGKVEATACEADAISLMPISSSDHQPRVSFLFLSLK